MTAPTPAGLRQQMAEFERLLVAYGNAYHDIAGWRNDSDSPEPHEWGQRLAAKRTALLTAYRAALAAGAEGERSEGQAVENEGVVPNNCAEQAPAASDPNDAASAVGLGSALPRPASPAAGERERERVTKALVTVLTAECYEHPDAIDETAAREGLAEPSRHWWEVRELELGAIAQHLLAHGLTVRPAEEPLNEAGIEAAEHSVSDAVHRRSKTGHAVSFDEMVRIAVGTYLATPPTRERGKGA